MMLCAAALPRLSPIPSSNYSSGVAQSSLGGGGAAAAHLSLLKKGRSLSSGMGEGSMRGASGGINIDVHSLRFAALSTLQLKALSPHGQIYLELIEFQVHEQIS